MNWMPINEEYEISDTGDVRSLPRKVRFVSKLGRECLREISPRVLVPSMTKSGYLSLRIGKKKVVQIHVAVLEAHIGPRPNGCEAAHTNGVKTDNRLANLSWVFRSENQYHRYHHRTRGFKLTEADVIRACAMRKSGATLASVAEAVGVSRQHAYRITSGKNLGAWATNWRAEP
jgi:hypothetical protein